MIKRRMDWEQRLREYVTQNRSRAFSWGSFDCCLFACNVVREMTGTDIAATWRGTYRTKVGAYRITNGNLEKFVTQIAKDHEIEEIKKRDVSQGDVIFTANGGGSLGVISFERLPMFAHSHGLALYPLSAIDRAWRIE